MVIVTSPTETVTSVPPRRPRQCTPAIPPWCTHICELKLRSQEADDIDSILIKLHHAYDVSKLISILAPRCGTLIVHCHCL